MHKAEKTINLNRTRTDTLALAENDIKQVCKCIPYVYEFT